MKISKIIAIVGSALLLISFFLPWESLSFMGTKIVYSGYQKAAGSPPGNYKLSADPSDYGAESDLDYINQVLGELLGGTLSGSEIGALSGMTDAINRALAKPVLYFFPIAAILVVVFSILSNRKPHISFGIAMGALAVVLGIILFTQGKSMSKLMNLSDLGGSVLSLFGMQELVPTTQFEIGFFGTAAGLLVYLAAGFLGWQEFTKPANVPERASFQTPQSSPYQAQSYQQPYAANPPQQPQPQGRQDNTYPTNQNSAAFLYQQNHLDYSNQNYQRSAMPPQQNGPYTNPTGYTNFPQQDDDATRLDQPSSQYQSYPQQPPPPPQDTPNNPVAGWRPIMPPKDPRKR